MSSRTPVNGVGYDRSLLADAPLVTKADKQEGYNPDLLEAQPNSRATPVPRGGATTPSRTKYTGASDDGHLRNAAVAQPPPTKTRPRKAIFIIVGVVLLVIIAVGVGVGVGVSKSHSGAIGPATQGGQAGSNTTKPIGSVTSTSTKDTSQAATQAGAVSASDGAAQSDNPASPSAKSTDD